MTDTPIALGAGSLRLTAYRPLRFIGPLEAIVVSALADVLRIGGEPGFGYKQGVGVLVGVALIIAGLWWRLRRGWGRGRR